MNDKKGYISIQPWMVNDLGLKGNDLIVYALIHGFSQDGESYYRGSVRYLMESTNLSKEAVLSVLNRLTDRKIVLKKIVKSCPSGSGIKEARGAQHFCLYCTAASRTTVKTGNLENGDFGSGNLTRSEDFGSGNLTRSEDFGSGMLTRNEDFGSGMLTRSEDFGSGMLTRSGQESCPNIKEKEKKNSSSSQILSEMSEMQKKQEKAPSTENTIRELFFGNYVFDNSFAGDIEALASEFSLPPEELPGYLRYVYSEARARNPRSLVNMYYTLAKSKTMMQDFVMAHRAQNTQTEDSSTEHMTCPVCGGLHFKGSSCTTCGFDMCDSTDEASVSRSRQIYRLLPETKKLFQQDYEAELNRRQAFTLKDIASNPQLREDFRRRMAAIYTKYGISVPECAVRVPDGGMK